MRVYIHNSPLNDGNAIRGVGVYTRLLTQELTALQDEHFQIVSDISQADVVHYPFFDLFFHTLPLSFVPRRQKVVVTIHDVIPLLFPDHYPVGFRGKMNHFLQRRALSHVAAVMTDSMASKEDIVHFLRYPTPAIAVVPLAGQPEIQRLPDDQFSQISPLLQRYGIPAKYVLYVGDINYNKNIPELIRALSLLDPKTHLVCVGKNFRSQSIPEWQQIQHMIDTTKTAERIHFISDLGSDATAVLSAMYTRAACVVQPSLYEGFGLPVLESLQCGTPVVCAKNSSLAEVGGDVVEFVQTHAESIADGVRKVIDPTAWYHTDGWNVRVAHHLSQFSWKKTAQQTKEVYLSSSATSRFS